MKQKAVFLDRDGIINHLIPRSDGRLTSPHDIGEFKFMEDIVTAAQLLKAEGYALFCVTNQPGVHDGEMSRQQLNSIMQRVSLTLGLTDYRCALDKGSIGYKPGNGMIEELIAKYKVDRQKSFMVGDRWKDIEAGHRSGLQTIYVHASQAYTKPDEFVANPDFTANSSLEFCKIIIER